MEEKKERDNELVVLGRIMRALSDQEPYARTRILQYLNSWCLGPINRVEVLEKHTTDLARSQAAN